MKQRTLLLIALLLCGSAWGQEETENTPALPHYNYRIDSTTFLIGDQAILAVEKTPVYPTLEELSNHDIVAVRQWIDTTDGTLYTALTSFEEGEHWLQVGDDSLLLTVRDVEGVDTTTTNIRDVAGIMSQPYTFGEVAHNLLLFCGFWLLVAAIILAYLRLKKKTPLIGQPQEPILPPDTRALQRLEALRNKGLWQQGLLKDYYTELTDTLRDYLEERYHIPSTEMTTDQTLDAFSTCIAHTAENESLLRQVLQTADMVKFAKSEPQPYQHDLAYGQSVDFIRQTTASTPDTNTETAETDTPQP